MKTFVTGGTGALGPPAGHRGTRCTHELLEIRFHGHGYEGASTMTIRLSGSIASHRTAATR